MVNYCKSCGGNLVLIDGMYICEFCGKSILKVEKISNVIVDLNKANKEMYALNFDVAKQMYQDIIEKYKNENLIDAYWNLFLCDKNVICEKNDKGELFPIIYKISIENIRENVHFKNALCYAEKYNVQKIKAFNDIADKLENQNKLLAKSLNLESATTKTNESTDAKIKQLQVELLEKQNEINEKLKELKSIEEELITKKEKLQNDQGKLENVNKAFNDLPSNIFDRILESSNNVPLFIEEIAKKKCKSAIDIVRDNELAQEYFDTGNYTLAVKLWRENAYFNDAKAQYNYGMCLENGYGIERDDQLAAEMYSKAVYEGVITTCSTSSGTYCDFPQYGPQYSPYNTDKSFEWFLSSAKLGNPDAQYKVGEICECSTNVENNFYDALNWYTQAAKQNCEKAKEKIKELINLI